MAPDSCMEPNPPQDMDDIWETSGRPFPELRAPLRRCHTANIQWSAVQAQVYFPGVGLGKFSLCTHMVSLTCWCPASLTNRCYWQDTLLCNAHGSVLLLISWNEMRQFCFLALGWTTLCRGQFYDQIQSCFSSSTVTKENSLGLSAYFFVKLPGERGRGKQNFATVFLTMFTQRRGILKNLLFNMWESGKKNDCAA